MQLTIVAHATALVWEWKMSGKSPRMPQQHPKHDYITNHPPKYTSPHFVEECPSSD